MKYLFLIPFLFFLFSCASLETNVKAKYYYPGLKVRYINYDEIINSAEIDLKEHRISIETYNLLTDNAPKSGEIILKFVSENIEFASTNNWTYVLLDSLGNEFKRINGSNKNPELSMYNFYNYDYIYLYDEICNPFTLIMFYNRSKKKYIYTIYPLCKRKEPNQ